jgi:hypothetical protein
MFVLLLLGSSLAIAGLSLQLGLREHRSDLSRVRVGLMIDGVVAETLGSLAEDPLFRGVPQTSSTEGEVWSAVTWESDAAVIEAGAWSGQRSESALLRVTRAPRGFRILIFRRNLGQSRLGGSTPNDR